MRISVIIPTKNRKYELLVALESLASQTVVPDQVVVIDDGSDFVVESSVDDEFKSKLNIKFIRNDISLGAAISRNIGVDASNCEIVVFLDSDDKFVPEYIEDLKNYWVSAPSAVGGGASGFFWCDSNYYPYKTHTVNKLISRDNLLVEGNFVGGCSVLSFKKTIFIEAGGFNSNLKGSDDYDLLLRISSIADIGYISKPSVLYQSPSFSNIDNMTKNYSNQIAALSKIYSNLSTIDKLKMDPQYRILLAYLYALNGDSKKSLASLLKCSFRKMKMQYLMKVMFIYVFGERIFFKVLRIVANLKMRFIKISA